MACKFPLLRHRETGEVIGQREYENKIYYYSRAQSKNIITGQPQAWTEITPGDLIRDSGWQMIPCGKCTECRLAYAREWANRISMENMMHEESWFVTLTYNPETVPHLIHDTGEITRGGVGTIENGKVTSSLTLMPDDLQRFWKRLRRSIEYSATKGLKTKRNASTEQKERIKSEREAILGKLAIKYYGVGEYGSKTARPHYHAIIFNLHIPDLIFYKFNENHQPLFTSEWLANIWGYGYVVIGTVTWDSACYVARYMMKKQKGPDAAEHYHELGQIPEFSRMSLKPGIGTKYYELNKEQIYKFDEIIIPGGKDGLGKIAKPPRYFDRLYDQEEPEEMAAIKERREQIAKDQLQIKMAKTTNELWQQLKTEHEAKRDSYAKLVRPLD